MQSNDDSTIHERDEPILFQPGERTKVRRIGQPHDCMIGLQKKIVVTNDRVSWCGIQHITFFSAIQFRIDHNVSFTRTEVEVCTLLT